MPYDPNIKLSHLIWGAVGAAAALWLSRSRLEDAKKSRAERDDPEGAESVVNEIGAVLEAWEPEDNCESEDDFTQDLADYLEGETDWEIEVYADSPEGKPDILIGDCLALELKVNPGKAERDRLVGQCAGYSRQWITWAVLIDTPASKVGHLADLLEDKGLEQILVWCFAGMGLR